MQKVSCLRGGEACHVCWIIGDCVDDGCHYKGLQREPDIYHIEKLTPAEKESRGRPKLAKTGLAETSLPGVIYSHKHFSVSRSAAEDMSGVTMSVYVREGGGRNCHLWPPSERLQQSAKQPIPRDLPSYKKAI